jgi:hypothetical protein
MATGRVKPIAGRYAVFDTLVNEPDPRRAQVYAREFFQWLKCSFAQLL